MSSQSGYVQWVLDGLVIESTTLEVLKETENNLPKNLTGKLLLGAIKFASGWYSVGNKVTGLNIYSSILPVETMVAMTQKGPGPCFDILLSCVTQDPLEFLVLDFSRVISHQDGFNRYIFQPFDSVPAVLH